MFRVSIVKLGKFGSFLNVSKQSQKLFFSSKNVNSLTPISHQLLKAKQDVVLAGMKERHELDIKYTQENLKERHQLEIKYSQEKQEVLLQFLEESHSVQLGKESNKGECSSKRFEEGTAAVPMESLPVVSIPKLFKDENEIVAFCDDIYNQKIKEFTPEISNKIVHVLTKCTSDTVCRCRVLFEVNSKYCEQNKKNVSAAGFGKALSTLLCVHSDNLDIVKWIKQLLWQDSILDVKFAQDFYDAIDSPDGYNGEIFDGLLKIMKRQNERELVETGFLLARYLIKNTKLAKSIMIDKGFLDILENFGDYHYHDALKRALLKE